MPKEPRSDFDPVRPRPPRFSELSNGERNALIREDPRWGHVICRCETVTEMEVMNAIHAVIPATNMDAVKRRTRTGMGRCQGGFCHNRVAAILARELGISITAVTKDGDGSPIFVGTAKDFLRGESA